MLLVFTEYNTGTSGHISVTLFKYGSRVTTAMRGANEEDPLGVVPVSHFKSSGDANSTADLDRSPKMSDVFSWQHIKYTVPVDGHKHRRLLDTISGYVAPQKLTALMGESGAGKVGDYLPAKFLC
jgi:ATP-binding cassette subfamily G (WHITE) protein 2 (SNQ2)